MNQRLVAMRRANSRADGSTNCGAHGEADDADAINADADDEEPDGNTDATADDTVHDCLSINEGLQRHALLSTLLAYSTDKSTLHVPR